MKTATMADVARQCRPIYVVEIGPFDKEGNPKKAFFIFAFPHLQTASRYFTKYRLRPPVGDWEFERDDNGYDSYHIINDDVTNWGKMYAIMFDRVTKPDHESN